MPKKGFQDMGDVQHHRNGYRAHVQYRNATGKKENIDGPERRKQLWPYQPFSTSKPCSQQP